MSNELFKIEGSVEVILEDKYGNVKAREKHKNTVTDGFQHYVMYDVFNHGTLANILSTSTDKSFNALARTVPSKFGVYALGELIDIKPETFAPPYVGNARNNLKNNVVFYNVEGDTVETNSVMLLFSRWSYYNNAEKELVIEYRKDSHFGTIKSICIGRAHDTQATLYATPLKDSKAPPNWFAYTANYLLEHTKENGTFIHRTSSATAASALNSSFNCKTKEFKDYGISAAMNGNITTYFGGLIAKDTLFKIAYKSASGTKYIATLTYIKDWKNSTTTGTLDITFDSLSGTINSTAYHPTLVYNTDTNKLEVFATIATGVHNGTYGCNIKKAIIDPASLEYSIVDLGIHSFGIGGFTTATVHTYLTGTYHDGKYYLPVYHMYEGSTLNAIANANWQEGIIIDEEFKGIIDFIPFRANATTSTSAVVITESGPRECLVNIVSSPYNYTTQIVSGVNLENPVTKLPDDLVRIIYRYKIL